ncbi:MAG: tetratricopeptide repeat protein, partial [Planctomycetota bacterium]
MSRPLFPLTATLGLALSCGGASPSAIEPPDLAAVEDVLDVDAFSELSGLTEAVAARPREAESWRALARAYETNELPAQAADAYEAAFAIEPDDAQTAYRAALKARQALDVDRAARLMAEVLELEPGYGPAWRRRGLWQLEAGDVVAARNSFERAAERLPGEPDGPLCLARAALLADDVSEAVEQAKVARERAPDDAYVQLVYGTALRRAGRVDEAAPFLTRGQGATPSFADPWSAAVSRDESRDEALAKRAEELEAKRLWDQAAEVWSELLDRRPDDSMVMRRLGLSLT